MFDFLSKPWNLWLNVECSFTRAGNHGEIDQASESDTRACTILGDYAGDSVLPTL